MRTTAPDHYQDVRLLSLTCPNIEWTPGDVLLVRPHNLSDRVNELFSLLAEYNLDFNADTVVQLREIDAGSYIKNKKFNFLTIQIEGIFYCS